MNLKLRHLGPEPLCGDVVEKPLIGITMGEPAGIGPEVIVKALADPAVRAQGRFIIYGLHELLAYAADAAEVNPFWFRMPHEEVGHIASGVVVADFDEYAALTAPLKRPTAEGGYASLRFLAEAQSAATDQRIDAIVTGPIHKVSWKMAGCKNPGHTEWLAQACDTRRVTMAFVAGRLRIALASTHVAISAIPNVFTIGHVFQPIDLLHHALVNWFGIENPKIAVAGLNPHAGEEGRFGDEETRIIKPAMLMAGEAGIEVEGPFPADTLFCPNRLGKYDGVVAMYHDQGLIPVKLLAFNEAVNVTLGLPIIRTSVDHGTAFDIVGQNLADPGSMKAAITLACRMATVRNATRKAASPAGQK
ncbi:MAG: 4-hydroxythreonine-4-phosphate dehydrogenase PdxA [Phycisphaerae bacterium]|nr:4-hydroxythreonine-4-phosphate dehydrogenase PdxA [Phycisphaerae bacterium]